LPAATAAVTLGGGLILDGATRISKGLNGIFGGPKPADGSVLENRSKNKVGPDPSASGPHSSIKRGPDGKISNYATYKPEPRNPSGHNEIKRVDVTGRPHTNPDGTSVPTPHVSEVGQPGVRPARLDELPK
jgi:hypothetical protein